MAIYLGLQRCPSPLFPKGANSAFRVRLIALVDLQVQSWCHCQTLIASEGVNLFSESKESPCSYPFLGMRHLFA